MLSLVDFFSFQKNSLQDFLSSLNALISTNESTEFITGHVIYNLAYTYLQISTENHPDKTSLLDIWAEQFAK